MTFAFDLDRFDEPVKNLQPLFLVEPPDTDKTSEQKRQERLLARLGPGVVAFSVPNEGRNSDWERLTRHRAGARAGAPDLVIAWNRGVAFLEMKGGKTAVKDNQIETLNALHRAGHHVAIWRDPVKAAEWLKGLGCPVRGRP
jgi:hypothetical protein